MPQDRRTFLAASAAAAVVAGSAAAAQDDKPRRRANRIAVSTYSFWQFRNKDLRDIEACIDLAAEMGFDGVEILHRQMDGRRQRATCSGSSAGPSCNGLDLCGFSTHQGFLSPDADVRQKNIDHTIRCIELAYALGIPTMRVNTGTWGTSKNFDELMKNRGIEPPLPGLHRRGGFGWVIDGLGECLQAAGEVRRDAGPGEPLGPGPHGARACCASSTRSSRPGCR